MLKDEINELINKNINNVSKISVRDQKDILCFAIFKQNIKNGINMVARDVHAPTDTLIGRCPIIECISLWDLKSPHKENFFNNVYSAELIHKRRLFNVIETVCYRFEDNFYNLFEKLKQNYYREGVLLEEPLFVVRHRAGGLEKIWCPTERDYDEMKIQGVDDSIMLKRPENQSRPDMKETPVEESKKKILSQISPFIEIPFSMKLGT